MNLINKYNAQYLNLIHEDLTKIQIKVNKTSKLSVCIISHLSGAVGYMI